MFSAMALLLLVVVVLVTVVVTRKTTTTFTTVTVQARPTTSAVAPIPSESPANSSRSSPVAVPSSPPGAFSLAWPAARNFILGDSGQTSCTGGVDRTGLSLDEEKVFVSGTDGNTDQDFSWSVCAPDRGKLRLDKAQGLAIGPADQPSSPQVCQDAVNSAPQTSLPPEKLPTGTSICVLTKSGNVAWVKITKLNPVGKDWFGYMRYNLHLTAILWKTN